MQNISLGDIGKVIIHYIGNKGNEEGAKFSEELTDFSSIVLQLQKLLANNLKTEELYNLYFTPTLELNPVYQFTSKIFENKESFVDQSKNFGRYLYDKSTHPNIKSGELCVVYIKDCQFDDEVIDALVVFKIESKETVIKVDSTSVGFNLSNVAGMNVNKLEKACFIFNTKKDDGFIVSVIDNTNRSGEAHYWKDEFLGVRPLCDEYHQTNEFLGITKQFVTKQLAEDFEVSKTEQIDLLNRSVDYFKKHEKFEKDEFEQEVFGDSSVIESFRKFDEEFRQNNELNLSDNFDISRSAVKKQARVFKNILKLDKNFDIHIHGDKNLIEKGVETDGRKYYKIYYDEEK